MFLKIPDCPPGLSCCWGWACISPLWYFSSSPPSRPRDWSAPGWWPALWSTSRNIWWSGNSFSRTSQFKAHYMWVLPVEVRDNDWNGQSDAENSTDGTEWRYELPPWRLRSDVSIASAGHGDDGPVQGLGQRIERRVRLVLLQGVGQACEYQHPHADSHGEEEQLSGTEFLTSVRHPNIFIFLTGDCSAGWRRESSDPWYGEIIWKSAKFAKFEISELLWPSTPENIESWECWGKLRWRREVCRTDQLYSRNWWRNWTETKTENVMHRYQIFKDFVRRLEDFRIW